MRRGMWHIQGDEIVLTRPVQPATEVGLLEANDVYGFRCKVCRCPVVSGSRDRVLIQHYHNCSAGPVERRLSYQPAYLW